MKKFVLQYLKAKKLHPCKLLKSQTDDFECHVNCTPTKRVCAFSHCKFFRIAEPDYVLTGPDGLSLDHVQCHVDKVLEYAREIARLVFQVN